uniref:Reverse transcriptase domain-containing protein n=1 Tax=Nicotiana tabacum TaxID=4097 RepID=A0A1S3XE76_TOBAC|nr:PREDICTED: uncharacterized protein LOC107764153 [Nicotiana tabacum]
MATLNYFHQHCYIERSCNASFIALIPKKKGSIELMEYIPISLIGSVYKIVAKVLAERLKKVIGKLVSSHQNAFIKHRHITDAALIANKGRDGFFSPQKGIRQGDPLFPFLFILAMEGLSKMMEKDRQMQWIQGFSVGTNTENSVTISHLLYAHDTLIFCEANIFQILYLNLTLQLFEALSGLYINKQKSIIYPVNHVSNIEELAGIIGCSIGSLPTTYLGLPLGSKFKSYDIWNGVVENFEKRLTSWQQQYLSMGGRLTLISSVLDNIPTYFMSLFSIPKKVLKWLDKIKRDFLWEGNNSSHKYHLIKWDKVLQPKCKGGLGVRYLDKHNKGLLMKWLWRNGTCKPSLWKEVINAKHGIKDNWSTKIVGASHGVGP